MFERNGQENAQKSERSKEESSTRSVHGSRHDERHLNFCTYSLIQNPWPSERMQHIFVEIAHSVGIDAQWFHPRLRAWSAQTVPSPPHKTDHWPRNTRVDLRPLISPVRHSSFQWWSPKIPAPKELDFTTFGKPNILQWRKRMSSWWSVVGSAVYWLKHGSL